MAKDTQTDIYSIFGIDKETYEKAKDILPTFELGKLEVGDSAIIQFMEELPRKIEVADTFSKKKDEKREVAVINVFVEKILRKDETGYLEVPIGEKQTMFLSSKSLSLSAMKICKDNGGSLQGIKAKISISMADYKEFGRNRAYNIMQL